MPRRKKNEQNQFRSYYCDQCYQAKPCGLLTSSPYENWKGSCCRCYYQWRKNDYQKHSDFATNLAREKEKWLTTNQKLIILQNYSGCPQCRSYEVNDDILQQEGKIVCQPCWKAQLKKLKPYDFAGYGFSWAFWYQICKRWKINLDEWMEKFQVRPFDYKCAVQWLTNPNHLPPHCGCLEQKAHELAQLFTDNWQRLQEKIKKCSCQRSTKTRTDFEWTECESCGKRLNAARKKRVIKNRNDPEFWGLRVEKRILCLACLKNFQKLIPIRRKRKLLNEYLKRGYV